MRMFQRKQFNPNRKPMTVQNQRTLWMSEFTLIEAAGNAKPKVVGLAYSGGKMNLPGWKYPVVVDLGGMEIPASVPLLTNHENKTDARVGMATGCPVFRSAARRVGRSADCPDRPPHRPDRRFHARPVSVSFPIFPVFPRRST